MKAVGLNPFNRPMKEQLRKVIGTRPNVDKIFEELVKHRISLLGKQINSFLIKANVGSQLRCFKSKVGAENGKNQTVLLSGSYVFESKRKKETLDSCLTKLRGLLYNSDTIPVQLRERLSGLPNSRSKARSILPKYTYLFTQKSTFNWLPILKSKNLIAYAIRANGDKLVIRFVATLKDDVSLAATKYDHNKKLLKYWSNTVKI
jgi:hypothetical protein